jgi:lipopolysaccharide transport system permease protein
MNSTQTIASLTHIPVTDITPPRGWLDVNLAEWWHFRELLYFFVWRDLKVRYKQTAIGVGWVILQPFLTMMVFTLFFGRLAKIPSEGLPYPLFYYSALLPWTYFAGALTNASNSMVEHQQMITKIYFPRIFLPLSAICSGLVDFAIGFVLLIGMVLFYRVPLTSSALLVPLFLLLAVATALAVGLWLSALNAIYRDVRYIVPFLVQFWLFASPVAYPSQLIPLQWRWLYGLNPMAGVIEGFRWSLSGHGQPPTAMILVSAGAVFILLIAGLVNFHKLESTIADRI